MNYKFANRWQRYVNIKLLKEEKRCYLHQLVAFLLLILQLFVYLCIFLTISLDINQISYDLLFDLRILTLLPD